MFKSFLVKIFFILSSVNLLANSMPVVFIGAYTASNQDTLKNLVVPNTPSGVKKDNWNLTHYTEELFRTQFKEQLKQGDSEIMLMREFSQNAQEIINNADDLDKKIAFLNVDTYQNIDKNEAGYELITVTLSLIFARIGEEENRAGEESNFEVRYTNGITVSGVLEIAPNDASREKKIHKSYRKFYKQAIGDLISLIVEDNKAKKVASFSSDDIYFSVGNVNLGKKSKELATQVYGSKDQAQKQILMMLQESLIKEIRQDRALDDVVLLYPDKLNDIIVNNWSSYLERMNEFSLDGNKNGSSDVMVRSIKPSCQKGSHSPREIPLDGYLIEVFVSELYDIVTEKEDVDSVHAIKSSLVSRIVIPLATKKKIDGLSTPDDIIKKKKVCVAQSSKGYTLENSMSSVRKDQVTKTIRKSVEKASAKLFVMMQEIVKKRGIGIQYEEFCQE